MKNILLFVICGIFIFACSAGLAGLVWAQPAGKDIVDSACTKCHTIKRVEQANKTAAQWETTLDRMIKKGAAVKQSDRETVLNYLNTLNK